MKSHNLFEVLDLPQNKFHRNRRKMKITFHPKLTYKIIVQTDMNKLLDIL